MSNIIFCYLSRVNMIFNCKIFSGKSESIPSHRIKNIIALKSFLSCYNIKRSIRTGMTNMKPLSAWIREFYKTIEFRKRIIILCSKSILTVPHILPFRFNLFKIVIHYTNPPKVFLYLIYRRLPKDVQG